MALNKKRGVSEVIATVVIIALTMVLAGIVWFAVNSLVKEKIDESESCGITNEVEINPSYTCYNQTTGNDEFWFSINVGEVEGLEDILVSISGQGTSATFKVEADAGNLLNYPDRTASSGIPGAGEGKTYIYNLPAAFTQKPEMIQIAPLINGKQCVVSSSLGQIDDCSALA